MTSETLDVETDQAETESLTESQPSSSGNDSNGGTSVQLISKQNTTYKVWDYLDLFQATQLTLTLLPVSYALRK